VHQAGIRAFGYPGGWISEFKETELLKKELLKKEKIHG